MRPLTQKRAIRDALAGFQLAAMNIPQALGYTKIAGMPVVTGFYTLLLPLVAFAAFGSSRYLVVAADSATAAILSGGLAGLAPLGSARYVELASLVALLTAVFLLLARVAEARLSGRLPFADRAGRLPHRRWLPGRHRGVGRDASASRLPPAAPCCN